MLIDNDASVDLFDVQEERHRRFLVTRPIGFVVGAAVVLPLNWFWDERRMLWLAGGMILMAAASLPARAGRVTLLTGLLLLDVAWTGVVIGVLGVHPLAASLLFAGHVSTAYLTLPVRNSRTIVGAIAGVLTVLVLASLGPPPTMSGTRILVTEGVMALFGLASVVGDFELIGKAIRSVGMQRRHDLESATYVAEQRSAALRTVSHELRTPLTSIGGFAHFLASEHLSHEDRVEFATRIKNESVHLNHLVDDLLAGVRLDSGQLTLQLGPVALIDTTKLMADVFRPRGLDIVIEVDPSHTVEADVARLGQILRNLFSNVEKYGGGTARVSSRRIRSSFVLSVADEGPGVNVVDRARIFQDFAQSGAASHLTGTGLGLGISRRLARAMGGDLVCVDVATGACFELALPAHA